MARKFIFKGKGRRRKSKREDCQSQFLTTKGIEMDQDIPDRIVTIDEMDETTYKECQSEAKTLYNKHLSLLKEKSTEDEAIQRIEDLHDQAYNHKVNPSIWPYLFRSPFTIKPALRKLTGSYFEHIVEHLICTIPNVKVSKVGKVADRRFFLEGESGVTIDIECKLQSDKTSILRNGFDHMCNSKSLYSGIVCPTNNFIGKGDDPQKEEDLVGYFMKAVNEEDESTRQSKAEKIIVNIRDQECGLFWLDEDKKRFIWIIGKQCDDYKIIHFEGGEFQGEINHSNNGGSKTWKPTKPAIKNGLQELKKLSFKHTLDEEDIDVKKGK